MTRQRAAVVAVIAALTLLGFLQFPGHTWLQQDTQIYMPMLERIWDPSALQRDLIASKPHLSFTIYDESAIALRWATGMTFEALLLAEQIVFRALELLGAYLLARSFDLSRPAAALTVACFGLGATIAGPAVLTFEYEPVPRGFALGLLFLSIGLASRGAMLPAACSAALAFLYQAPSTIPVWIVLFVISIRRRDYKMLLPFAAACLILLGVSRFQAGATEAQPFFARIDPEWEKIERIRASYNWVSTWAGSLMWQYLFLWAAALASLLRLRPGRGRIFAIVLPSIGILSVPLSYLLTENLKWALMPQVQPARSLVFVTAFAVILAAAAAARAMERKAWWESILWFALVFAIPLQTVLFDITAPRLLLAFALAGLASGAVAIARGRIAIAALGAAAIIPYFAIPYLGGVENYPRPHTRELGELVQYARANTSKNAMFLFPDAGRALYPGRFRAEAVRAVYVDWKAGGQVNYFRSLAEEWWTRWRATMTGRDVAANLNRFGALGIDYAVLQKRNTIAALTPAYANEDYVVYRLRSSSTSARVGTELCAPSRVTEIAAAAFANRSASPSGLCSASATASAALKTSPAAVASRAVTGIAGLKISLASSK